jgi:DNA-binding PadR family transcriptional regulator
MLEIMILYAIWDVELSMYSISKRIHEVFGDFSTPSFGSIKPSLKKMENLGYIKSRKTFSEGGKLTVYYILTSEGKKALKTMMFDDMTSNPFRVKNFCAVKIIVSEILSKEQQSALFTTLSHQIEILKIEAERKLQNNKKMKAYQRILIDNLVLEYENFLKLITRLGN